MEYFSPITQGFQGTGALIDRTKRTGASIVDTWDGCIDRRPRGHRFSLSPASWWEKLLCNKALKKHVQIFYDVWVM